MRLRNKKTGEIRKAEAREGGIYLWDELTGHWWKYELDVLASSWEYYVESKEPLIKDKKIRKAVRAWSEVCGLSYVTYKQASNEFYDPYTRGAFAIRFRLIPVEVYLEDGECYTIDELCGEEEG